MPKESSGSTPDVPSVHIHVAGSCHHNPGGCGGWGFVIADFCNKRVLRRSGGLPAADGLTNIRAEMVAVVEALKAVPEGTSAILWTNAPHLTKSVAFNQRRRKSLDLWKAIDALAVNRRIEWRIARFPDKPEETVEAQQMARRETTRMVKRGAGNMPREIVGILNKAAANA